ncbi:MAG: LITAF-like zinc ribbon domain-containing protein, partial [Acidobacteria bacterium]|nr:LITAF-like zinc ribbon domain-containing protein [Acidobacteriota bacterium]
SARICRYCGTVLEHSSTQRSGAQSGAYAPPRQAAPSAAYSPQPLETYSPPGAAVGGYRCPNCQSTSPPITEKRISTEGWIVFCALLIFCLPLFFIGLLMKEEIRVCSACRTRLA